MFGFHNPYGVREVAFEFCEDGLRLPFDILCVPSSIFWCRYNVSLWNDVEFVCFIAVICAGTKFSFDFFDLDVYCRKDFLFVFHDTSDKLR